MQALDRNFAIDMPDLETDEECRAQAFHRMPFQYFAIYCVIIAHSLIDFFAPLL